MYLYNYRLLGIWIRWDAFRLDKCSRLSSAVHRTNPQVKPENMAQKCSARIHGLSLHPQLNGKEVTWLGTWVACERQEWKAWVHEVFACWQEDCRLLKRNATVVTMIIMI